MKKFLLFMLCGALLCSCNSKKETFENWKGYVASKAYGNVLYDCFRDEYGIRDFDMKDLSLDMENQIFTVGWCEQKDLPNDNVGLKTISKHITETWTVDDRSGFIKTIYYLYSSYAHDYPHFIKNNREYSDDSLFEDFIRYIFRPTFGDIKQIDGKYYLEKVSEPLPESILKKYNLYEFFSKNESDDWFTIYLDVDWIFHNEKNLESFKNDVFKIYGRYSDFCNFAKDCVSIEHYEKMESKSGRDVYHVTYEVSHKNAKTVYALCRILLDEDGRSEIQLLRTSEHLVDLS